MRFRKSYKTLATPALPDPGPSVHADPDDNRRKAFAGSPPREPSRDSPRGRSHDEFPIALPCRNRYISSDPVPGSSAGSSPSDPPRDPSAASSSDNRRLESGSRGSALPAGSIPSPGGEQESSSGIIPRVIIAWSLLNQAEAPLIIILDKGYRERGLQDGSRFPFNRKRTILGHLPQGSYILAGLAPAGLPRFDEGTRGADLIL